MVCSPDFWLGLFFCRPPIEWSYYLTWHDCLELLILWLNPLTPFPCARLSLALSNPPRHILERHPPPLLDLMERHAKKLSCMFSPQSVSYDPPFDILIYFFMATADFIIMEVFYDSFLAIWSLFWVYVNLKPFCMHSSVGISLPSGWSRFSQLFLAPQSP